MLIDELLDKEARMNEAEESYLEAVSNTEEQIAELLGVPPVIVSVSLGNNYDLTIQLEPFSGVITDKMNDKLNDFIGTDSIIQIVNLEQYYSRTYDIQY